MKTKDGNSSEARSERAQNENRDSQGRFTSSNESGNKGGSSSRSGGSSSRSGSSSSRSEGSSSRSESSYRSKRGSLDHRGENAKNEPRDENGRFASSSNSRKK
ncbi:MAG: hypothetical protein LUD68_08070 [Rikenellaceae bacterium]|nr:hypothetical protein [Rikenellaceae bacterium]